MRKNHKKANINIIDTIGSIDDLIEKYEENIDQLKKTLEYKYRKIYEKSMIKKSINELGLYVTDFVANGSFKSLKDNTNIMDDDGYAYFIRNTDLKDNIFNKYVDIDTYNFLSKSYLKGNEILISNVGDVGSVYLCPFLNKPMTLGNNMIMVTFDNRNDNFYLYYYFKSYEGQFAISGITAGSAQQKFNKTDFRKLEIPFPDKNLLNDFNLEAKKYIDLINNYSSIKQKLLSLKQLYLNKFFN
ncbi:MAG: restriction endonuclease subunit S [Acholeplasmatales bacterium]|nr:restriction endonuclease subunit S [Acholeplasmatales bacterium]